MIRKYKGQASIEVILIVIFLIIFLSIFNNLAGDTAKTLETTKIIEQESLILDTLHSFLKVQEGLINNPVDLDISDFNISFHVPEIRVPSKNVFCDIYITSSSLTMNTYTYDDVVTINKKVNFDFTKINFSKTIIKSCGDTLTCTLQDGMVSCD
jgi:hypothetical protein